MSPFFCMLFLYAFRQLQLSQNATARAPTKTNTVDHLSPGLSPLQWLPLLKKKINLYFFLSSTRLLLYEALNG